MATLGRLIVLSVAAVIVAGAGGTALGAGPVGPEMVVAQLSGANRNSFVQSSIESCTATAKQNNPQIPAATVTTYCTCMANKEADMTTEADVEYMAQHKAPTEDYKQRVQALAPACNAAAGLK